MSVYDQDHDADTRGDHVRWCKQRALAYVDRGDLVNALASMTSDMRKHPSTADDLTISTLLALEGTAAVMANDAHRMRRLIEGFAE